MQPNPPGSPSHRTPSAHPPIGSDSGAPGPTELPPPAWGALLAHLEKLAAAETPPAQNKIDVQAPSANPAPLPQRTPIPVSESELRIAAGASETGSVDLITTEIYGRYAESIRNLSSELEPALQPHLLESARLLTNMRNIFGFNAFVSGEAKETLRHQLLEDLKANGRILIPAFSTHHAMLAEIELLPDGRYTLRIFNSGEGLDKNHSAAPDGRKNAAFVEYSFDSLDDAHLAELLDLGARADPLNYSKSQDVYDWAAKLPGAEKVNVPASEMTWQTPQKSGDCTLEVVNAFLRDNMKRAVAKDPALQDRGEHCARQAYLEMKAAYLDQCRTDYLQQKGRSRESAPLLELLKVRADRAHVSAGFSGGNGLRAGAGVIRAIKGHLRLSSQLQDLATSSLEKGYVWHINQQVEVSIIPSNSGDDVVTFKERGPRNRTFQVNKTTGAVTIKDPEFTNFHMQMEPRFDANHRLVSISVSEGTGGKVEKQRTYFQLDTSEMAANAGLSKYLNKADIENLSKVKGSLYLSVEDLGSGHFDLKGFLYDESMSSAAKLGKSTLGEDLIISAPMRAEGAQLAAGDSESRPSVSVIDDLATPVQPGTSDPQNAARPTSTVINSSLAEIEDEIDSLWQKRRLVAQLSPEGNTRTIRIPHDDGSISSAQYRDLRDGRFMVTSWTLAEDGKSLTYNCRTLGPETIVTVDAGRVDLTDVNRDSVIDELKAAKPGEVAEAVRPTSWNKRRTEPGSADHEYLVTETAKDENGTQKIVTTQIRKQPAADAAASANAQVSSEVHMPPEDAALLSLDPQGEPIEVVEITTQAPGPDGQLVKEVQTQYLQDRPDGSSRALVRTQTQTGQQSSPGEGLVEWRSQLECSLNNESQRVFDPPPLEDSSPHNPIDKKFSSKIPSSFEFKRPVRIILVFILNSRPLEVFLIKGQ